MKDDFTGTERHAVQHILLHLSEGRLKQGIDDLRILKDDVYASIPASKRISRGITWVVERIALLLVQASGEEMQIDQLALAIYNLLDEGDQLSGVPIFMMGEYGKRYPEETFAFFERAGSSTDWVVREFAAGAFRRMISDNRQVAFDWLMTAVESDNPYLRRMVSETLRPVTDLKWLQKEPQVSLRVLRRLFHEKHPYPRTSVGNNLSDLSRGNPELILDIVRELVQNNDPNSYWIAYRACRNLVKKEPGRVMDLLGVDVYQYKDRNYSRERIPGQ